jgi:hypothetical protein
LIYARRMRRMKTVVLQSGKGKNKRVGIIIGMKEI